MSNLEIGLVVGFIILMWRIGIVQSEVAALKQKLQGREDEQKVNPLAARDDLDEFATRDDLDAAISQIVEAVGEVGLAVANIEPPRTSTTFPVILPGHYKPSE